MVGNRKEIDILAIHNFVLKWGSELQKKKQRATTTTTKTHSQISHETRINWWILLRVRYKRYEHSQ